ARAAQKIYENYTQEQVDEIVAAIAWAGVKEDNAKAISELAMEESKLGNYASKYGKLQKKIRGAQRDIKDLKTVGVIETIPDKGIKKIAKPVGVIGAIVPCTNPEATPFIKAMFALKARNAVVFSPHPRSKKTNFFIVSIMRDVLKKYDAPEDLLISVQEPTIDISNEVMKQCDLVIATGGSALVKAAYSSGKPAYGVGVGNAVVIVDETCDIKDAANKIMLSKTFDFATSCSAENSLVVHDSVYDELLEALQSEGGYLVPREEKTQLQNAMWPDGEHLSAKIVAQEASIIAKEAGITIGDDKKFFMVREEGVGEGYLFSNEKMSVVVAIYKYSGSIENGVAKVNEITTHMGAGHSCGIHSTSEEHIMTMALGTKTSRVIIRQPQCYANSGDWVNGMPFTLTLGCGTWGGNISSENIALKHFYNTTWVSYPIDAVIPDDKELFGSAMED
ncbi:MAG: aldehyde dehydrogenase family protein, partial [Clostridia bacterium]|nr:aldehyde dehydrogenase family protein [Clostridia bacterium]